MQLFGTGLLKTYWAHDVDATSLRRIDVIMMSCACWEFGPPNILNLGPPNILNLPTPMSTASLRLTWILIVMFCFPAATRYASAQPGLVNCSWFSSRSCCKRTEVTSVFSANMPPLYQATTDCQNKMNYMMCYFCSPEQFHWYKEWVYCCCMLLISL